MRSIVKIIIALAILAIIALGIGFLYKAQIKETYREYKRGKGSNSYLDERIKAFEIHGIDISQHQGKVDWSLVKHPDTAKTIDFILIRATVGTKSDTRFVFNYTAAKKANIARGAYHYYWSNVNSTEQANHFIANVTLTKGDLPPVLDIEDLSSIQDIESLRMGLKNWLSLVQGHYGVLPILYTNEVFYEDYLEDDPYFENYDRLWIANYNGIEQPDADWLFWQYTDRMAVKGFAELVDGNVFKSTRADFDKLRL